MTDKIQLVNTTKLEQDLTSLANKIREKTGATGQLSFPDGMESAIDSLDSPYLLQGYWQLRENIGPGFGDYDVSYSATQNFIFYGYINGEFVSEGEASFGDNYTYLTLNVNGVNVLSTEGHPEYLSSALDRLIVGFGNTPQAVPKKFYDWFISNATAVFDYKKGTIFYNTLKDIPQTQGNVPIEFDNCPLWNYSSPSFYTYTFKIKPEYMILSINLQLKGAQYDSTGFVTVSLSENGVIYGHIPFSLTTSTTPTVYGPWFEEGKEIYFDLNINWDGIDTLTVKAEGKFKSQTGGAPENYRYTFTQFVGNIKYILKEDIDKINNPVS